MALLWPGIFHSYLMLILDANKELIIPGGYYYDDEETL